MRDRVFESGADQDLEVLEYIFVFVSVLIRRYS